ncbi:competence protein ComK [Bacillus sp. OV322]|uniref:competence protein ComK n=1 Tax=Bacillus sp. OV322 TaxID=1882764 RepID=UPI0008E9518C|nr:competence protein ComK [Bacillus sp. OV322]SFC80469.1 competence protein ComK [Bacillus sp. OV322]
MLLLPNYVINEDTILIASHFDSLSNWYSKVMEGKHIFYVAMPPYRIVEESIIYYGSSMSGAIKSSHSILGNIKMSPIPINLKQDIYWFPSVSMKRDDCVWLAHHHIDEVNKLSPKRTLILLKYGHSVILDVKEQTIKERVSRTAHLQYYLNKRSREKYSFLFEPQQGFHFVKEAGEVNYTVKKK